MTAATSLAPHYRSLIASPSVRIAGGAAAFVAAAVSSSSDDGLVLCPFRRCTGGYCPGCGLTRSSGKLVRGDLIGSWQHHPFLIIGLVQALVLVALWGTGSRLWPALAGRGTTIVVVNTALVVTIWLARLATATVPGPSYLTSPFG